MTAPEYTIAVVVEIKPDNQGNLAMAEAYGEDGKPHPLSAIVALQLRAPVFRLGEILILDEDGREFGGMGRKPAKWAIGLEHFLDLGPALLRAREVSS